jgi:hypothetical protein
MAVARHQAEVSQGPRFLGLGVFLVSLGAVPLAVQLGWIDARGAAGILRLWPLVIIAIGVSIALHFTPYRVIGSVITAAVFGAILGVFLAAGAASPALACTSSTPPAAPAVQSGAFSSDKAQVNVELTCGKLQMTRTAETSWSVGVATTGATPVVRAQPAALDLRSANSRFIGPFPGGTDEHWNVALPASTTVSLGMTLNAASGDIALGEGAVDGISATLNGADASIDLRNATGLDGLSTTLNASSARLYLPSGQFDASVTLNVSSLKLCLAPDAAVAIGYSNVLGSQNFAAAGLQGGGEDWQTPGATVARLHITSNLSSISVDRSGACT